MNVSDASTLERQLPLCRTYLAVFLVHQAVETLEEEDSGSRSIQWGTSCSADGRFEVLGAWTAKDHVDGIPSSLRLRGLERVHLIVNDGAAPFGVPTPVSDGPCLLPSVVDLERRAVASVGPRSRATLVRSLRQLGEAECIRTAEAALSLIAQGCIGTRYPTVVVEWRVAIEQLRPLYALPPRLRRLTLLGDSLTQELRRKLGRSLRRHGAFPSDEAALPFVRRALFRAEPCLRNALAAQVATETRRTSSRSQASKVARAYV